MATAVWRILPGRQGQSPVLAFLPRRRHEHLHQGPPDHRSAQPVKQSVAVAALRAKLMQFRLAAGVGEGLPHRQRDRR
jgi:hypothetical protein